MKLLVFLAIFLSSLCFSQVDSSYIESSRIILKPRILIGTGFSTAAENDQASLLVFGNFNLRVASDKESWTNKSFDIFIEAGICYITESIAESDGNGIPYYFRFGSEIDLFKTILLCPSLGFVGVLNNGPEASGVAPTIGLSLNYTHPLTKKINMEFESGANVFSTGIFTPYLVIGVTF